MKRKSYATRRLEIRPYTINDYNAWFAAYTQCLPKKHQYDGSPYKPKDCSKDIFKGILKKYKVLSDEDKTYVWGVYEKKSGAQVGVFDIHIISRDDLQKANLGYRIFNSFWRNGYAEESVKKMLKISLIDLKLNRLEAVIDPDNKPSIKLVKKLGLRKEGLRENYYFQDGDWADQIIFIADRKLLRLPRLKV